MRNKYWNLEPFADLHCGIAGLTLARIFASQCDGPVSLVIVVSPNHILGFPGYVARRTFWCKSFEEAV
jgi:hypothetical protein